MSVTTTTDQMTSRQRILAAMRGQIPDRVPVQLGITNMFSVRHAGFDGWDIFLEHKRPYWQVVADAQRHFGLDGYLYLGGCPTGRRTDVSRSSQTITVDSETKVVRTTITTPEGELTEERTFLRWETASITKGLIENEDDFHRWMKYCLVEHEGFEFDTIEAGKAYLGEDGVVAACLDIPGMASLTDLFEGKLEAATYFAFDHPDLLAEYAEKATRIGLKHLEMLLDSPADYIQLGSSGMLTLSTPEWFRQLCLPFIQGATKLCRQAGVLTEMHCCGKARLVVETCANQTDLDSINPLQPPPMGDCDLAEVKRSFGDRLCLKGNVGVTQPLLLGTPDDVQRDVERCMAAAKEGGRFILFSEEGIGALTPHENVRRYVEVGRALGRY